MLSTSESFVVFLGAVAATLWLPAGSHQLVSREQNRNPAGEFLLQRRGHGSSFRGDGGCPPSLDHVEFLGAPVHDSRRPVDEWTRLLGSLYMGTSTLVVGRLGALGWVGPAFLGQVLGGSLLDYYGLLRLERHSLGVRCLAGIVLLIAAGYLAIIGR